MALPRSTVARRYYRAGKQRFEDAQFLLENARTTGAVYLAGYSVECMLKALILESVPVASQKELMDQFRGVRGHNIAWLRDRCRTLVRISVPEPVIRHLARLAPWSTDLRYQGGTIERKIADDFMKSALTVINWVDGKF